MDPLVQARCPDGRVWTYAYDPFGRRVSKESNGLRHDFLWDGDVIAREVVNGQAVDWFFEPRSFRPLARLEAGSLSYVVTDHLGTPKEVLSSEGALLWSSDHDTWGSLRTIRAAFVSGDYWTEEVTETLAETASITFCPIRFQGQWEDAETGLYYNVHRYFDNLTKQYSSADPTGIKGGLSLNGYVGFPSIMIDPLGLFGVYIFQTANGSCYVGKATDQTRFEQSMVERTGPAPRGDDSRDPANQGSQAQRAQARSCCSPALFRELVTPDNITGSRYAKLVEQTIMDMTGAVASDRWLNDSKSVAANRIGGADYPASAVEAAQRDATAILEDFRNSGARC